MGSSTLILLLIRLLYRVSNVTGSLPLNTLNIQVDIDFARATEACTSVFPTTDLRRLSLQGLVWMVGGVDCDPISNIIVAVLVAKGKFFDSVVSAFVAQ